MISAILAKLFTSVFKAASHGRFLKLVVGWLDVSFCLLSGLNLIGLMASATVLFRVNASDQWIFLISLFTRELIVIVLLCVVFEKPVAAAHKPDVYRYGAYLLILIICTLAKYAVQGGSLAIQAVLFQSGLIGSCYTLVFLSRRLYLSLQ